MSKRSARKAVPHPFMLGVTLWLACLVAGCRTGFAGAGSAASSIRLAVDGQTPYTIVASEKISGMKQVAVPENPAEMERAAVADLQHYLNEITGAEFPIGTADQYRIFVGVRAPSDTRELAISERRVKSENGDVYIYGQGLYGNTFAVYEFLEQLLGCRWYSAWGDQRIPRRPTLDFDEIDYAHVPSFRFLVLTGGGWFTPDAWGFFRKSRFHGQSAVGYKLYNQIGAANHVATQYIPPGPDHADHRFRTPYKYVTDKAYFETNPEFFGMRADGRRAPPRTLCYSHPDLRRTYRENLEITIENEYQGGEARMWADRSDSSFEGTTCLCPDCKALIETYQNPGGPYWDFMLELADYFQEHYPEITLVTNAYLVTETPPPTIDRFPDNISIHYSPLQTDFLKPLIHPHNRRFHDNLAEWAQKSNNFGLQLYPTVYPRPIATFPLVANINRLVENVQEAHALGVRWLRGEVGHYVLRNAGFNELRVFLLAQLNRDVAADVPALIEEFMEGYYGSAAPMMLDYYYELEEHEAAETNFMRWNPDPRGIFTYLTPENLLRWQAAFDEMEAFVARDARRLLNVKRARTNLDEATMSVFYKFDETNAPDIDKIYDRYVATIHADAEDMFRMFDNPETRERATDRFAVLWRIERGMNYYYRLAQGGKPLPDTFRRYPAERIFRAVPSKNQDVPPHDPEAAFDMAMVGPIGDRSELRFSMRYFFIAEGRYRTFEMPGFVPVDKLKGSSGYQFYPLGRARLSADSRLQTAEYFGWGSNITTGPAYDPAHSEALYDFYLSAKFVPPDSFALDQLVLVRTDDTAESWRPDMGVVEQEWE